jgi:hypothetical protein
MYDPNLYIVSFSWPHSNFGNNDARKIYVCNTGLCQRGTEQAYAALSVIFGSWLISNGLNRRHAHREYKTDSKKQQIRIEYNAL